MQTINFDINSLLKKIRGGQFLIPQFQRDFTWKEGQTRLLIDSIARNYPIGSLLILGKNEEVPLKSRKLDANYHAKNEQTEPSEDDEPGMESYYVLDGQQRLTSIARVFLDAHHKKNYYFDLKEMHESYDRENTSWIKSRRRGKTNPDRKDNNRLIRSDIVLDQEKCDVYISEYVEDSGDFPEFDDNRTKARQTAAKLKGIFEIIRKFSIPFVVLDTDAPLESVCRVFETINSTGTKLTTFDLAVARYYPDPDLKELLDTSQERYPILGEYDIDGERILQILSLYHLRKNDRFPEATRSNLLSLEENFIRDNWQNAACRLSETCEWIKNLGATPKTQPPHGTLVAIAAFLMCFPDNLKKSEFTMVLKKWYFCTTLAANPSPANNYKIGDDFRKFYDLAEKNSPIQYPHVYFSIDDLINIKHKADSRYKAIQALMRTTVTEDLMTGNPLNEDLENHHIFPYSLTKSGIKKNKINSIVNSIMISKDSNRDLSNINPDSYLVDLAEKHKTQGNTADFDRRLRNCFIPYKSTDPDLQAKLSKENFDQFLSDRASMIVQHIKGVVGDAYKLPTQDTQEKNLEDDEFVEG